MNSSCVKNDKPNDLLSKNVCDLHEDRYLSRNLALVKRSLRCHLYHRKGKDSFQLDQLAAGLHVCQRCRGQVTGARSGKEG